MLRRLFCAILGIISLNPFLRPAPQRKIEVSNNFKVATVFASHFIDTVEHFQNNEGVKIVYGDTFEIWDNPRVRPQKKIGWKGYVDTNSKKYPVLRLTMDADETLFHDKESARDDVMNLVISLMRDYFLHNTKPANAEKYKEELNGTQD